MDIDCPRGGEGRRLPLARCNSAIRLTARKCGTINGGYVWHGHDQSYTPNTNRGIQTQAVEALGISQRVLRYKTKTYGLEGRTD